MKRGIEKGGGGNPGPTEAARSVVSREGHTGEEEKEEEERRPLGSISLYGKRGRGGLVGKGFANLGDKIPLDTKKICRA